MGYRVLDYGAMGDGRHNDAEAIQKTIDFCAGQGGGRVILDGGHIFLSGSLVLKAHVELYIESGAVLKASENPEDYAFFKNMDGEKRQERPDVPSYMDCSYDGRPRQYFIYAKDADFVTVSGGGTLDGSEQIYYGEVQEDHIEGTYYPRIPMLFFEHCCHLTIRDVTLTGSAFWTVHLVGCEDVAVTGIRILNNRHMANCDGIDPDHCKRVRISDCHIEAGDDCIVMKTTEAYQKYGACEDIIISGCTLMSTSAAVKIGSESCSDFRNILVDHCIISDTNRGISVQLRDAGNVSGLTVSNCCIRTRLFSSCWWGTAEPVYITSRNRRSGRRSGTVSGITLCNLRCEGEGGIYLSGKPDQPLCDVTLENIRHVLKKTSGYPVVGYDLRPCEGPELEECRISGLDIRNARGVRMNNIQIRTEENMRPYTDGEIQLENTR